jgi:hypothetical protein
MLPRLSKKALEKDPPVHLPAESAKQREKLKEIQKQLEMTNKVTTEARAANAFASQFHSTVPRAVYGTIEDLPNFSRRVIISKPYPAIR